MDRIPKILHLYWDKSPMSKLQTFTIETFHNLNPDWEINVYIPIEKYTGSSKYIPDYNGIDYFYLIENMSFVNIIQIDLKHYCIREDLHNILRSDIFRYYILFENGGVWSDFDVIWLKPLSYINQVKTVGKVPISKMGAMVTLFQITEGHYNIGILISSKKHPFYQTLIDKTINIQKNPEKYHELYNHNKKEFKHQAFGAVMWKMIFPDLKNILDKFEDVVGFRYETFAPYSIFELENLYKKIDIRPLMNPNVVGLHWFNGHKLSKEYINQNNFGNQSSMTCLLQRLGYKND